jgi:hypothetical protein
MWFYTLEYIYHDTLEVMQQGIVFAQAFYFATDYFVVLQVQ